MSYFADMLMNKRVEKAVSSNSKDGQLTSVIEKKKAATK
jgi:hypothetical protein